MKKLSINISLLIVFVGLFGSSCQKVLDQKPQTEYSSQNFWQEPAQAGAALMGAYNRLQLALNNEYFYYGEGRADLDSLYTSNNVSAIGVIQNILNPNLPFADWGNFYDVIKQCNLIIANVPDMKSRGLYTATNNAEYNRVLGQAYGLRALCYFYMVRVWGNVPLITAPVPATDNFDIYKTPRTDSTEVFKSIANDLYTARALLPVSYTDANLTKITLTQGAIDAMLTDYYMTRNNMDSAIVFSDNVLKNTQYKLAALYDPNIDFFNASVSLNAVDNTDYAKMFINGFGAESIFEIDYNYAEGTSSGIAQVYGGGSGTALFCASVRMLNKFAVYPHDLRTLADLRNVEQVYKNFPKGSFDRTTENDKNVVVYRLSDIMLLRAEALLNTGNAAGAWNLIKTIRERAFGPVGAQYNNTLDGPTSAAQQAYFMGLPRGAAEDYILDERARELCFEGKRWFDLVRTGRVLSVMKPRYKNGVLIYNGITDPENILWPINLNIIKRNPLIEQNAYYK